ncbi:hypothetical protein D1AOALGA4SA_3587 [Olavius algarvensis Delta 1 endosymbiont]|nr:hypothetical protein D1AOALGA4SA_3587 [Olavius algarvensis Delta 1 endosymbiont]
MIKVENGTNSYLKNTDLSSLCQVERLEVLKAIFIESFFKD